MGNVHLDECSLYHTEGDSRVIPFKRLGQRSVLQTVRSPINVIHHPNQNIMCPLLITFIISSMPVTIFSSLVKY